MIKVRRFQPGNIRRDLKQMFEDRQRTANQSSSQDSVADSQRALQSDHPPIVGDRAKQINRSNQAKRERQQPNGEANPKARADQSTAPSYL